MADWGNIAVQGLLSGIVGLSEVALDDIREEENRIREEGYMRLREEFRIADREWEERVDAKRDERERRYRLEDREHSEKLAAADAADRERIAREDRDFRAKLAEDEKSRDMELQKLLYAKEEREGEAKAQSDAEKELLKIEKDLREGYMDYKESASLGAEETPLPFHEWASQSQPIAFGKLMATYEDAFKNAIDDAARSKNPKESMRAVVANLPPWVVPIAKQYASEKYPAGDDPPGADVPPGGGGQQVPGGLLDIGGQGWGGVRVEPDGKKRKNIITLEPDSWADKGLRGFLGWSRGQSWSKGD